MIKSGITYDQLKMTKLSTIKILVCTVILSSFILFGLTTKNVNAEVAPLCNLSILGPASSFNLFLFGDLIQSNVDSEGKVAVGGNADLTNFGVGSSLSNSNGKRDDLIVNGNLKYNSGEVHNGNIVYGGTSQINQLGTPNGTVKQGNPINFNSAQASLYSSSTSLAQLAENGTSIVSGGNLVLTGINNSMNVFTISSQELSGISSLQINVPLGSTVVVNVTGTTISMINFGFQYNGANRQNTVFNFYEATSLNISGIGFEGSILAPYADIQFNNGAINGNVVAKSLVGGGETHNYLFNGCINTSIVEITPIITISPTIPTTTLTITPTNTTILTPTLPITGSDEGGVGGIPVVDSQNKLAETGAFVLGAITFGFIAIVCVILVNNLKSRRF